jgi:succinyl-diaminopimelate desuccinylase
VNAIDRAVEGLRGIVGREPNEVVVEGLLFREVLSATMISGGRASNVIPDDVRCVLNFRYAPNRTAEEGWQRLQELVGPELEPRLLSNSPPARVVADTPLLRRLQEAGDFPLEPKQAWTPVAEFSGRGLDAVNLGPGATQYAHKRDEQIEIAALARSFEALRRFALA